jgi:hypothetical protein
MASHRRATRLATLSTCCRAEQNICLSFQLVHHFAEDGLLIFFGSGRVAFQDHLETGLQDRTNDVLEIVVAIEQSSYRFQRTFGPCQVALH